MFDTVINPYPFPVNVIVIPAGQLDTDFGISLGIGAAVDGVPNRVRLMMPMGDDVVIVYRPWRMS